VREMKGLAPLQTRNQMKPKVERSTKHPILKLKMKARHEKGANQAPLHVAKQSKLGLVPGYFFIVDREASISLSTRGE
jgi:hypothetical protein